MLCTEPVALATKQIYFERFSSFLKIFTFCCLKPIFWAIHTSLQQIDYNRTHFHISLNRQMIKPVCTLSNCIPLFLKQFSKNFMCRRNFRRSEFWRYLPLLVMLLLLKCKYLKKVWRFQKVIEEAPQNQKFRCYHFINLGISLV